MGSCWQLEGVRLNIPAAGLERAEVPRGLHAREELEWMSRDVLQKFRKLVRENKKEEKTNALASGKNLQNEFLIWMLFFFLFLLKHSF